MPFKMSKQARTELLSAWRAKYAPVSSRHKKATIMDDIIQSAGYKDCKTVIRMVSSKKIRLAREEREMKIVGRKELEIIKKI